MFTSHKFSIPELFCEAAAAVPGGKHIPLNQCIQITVIFFFMKTIKLNYLHNIPCILYLGLRVFLMCLLNLDDLGEVKVNMKSNLITLVT